jgi:hypothetical protein
MLSEESFELEPFDHQGRKEAVGRQAGRQAGIQTNDSNEL